MDVYICFIFSTPITLITLGARGGPGSDWFIMNVKEMLDEPGEFYYDRTTMSLYYVSNDTDPNTLWVNPNNASIEIVSQHTLINATGTSQDHPIVNLTLRGIGFRDTSPTMLEPHGVPSGGDWALERMGVVYLERTEHTLIDGIIFTRLGGNGLMISKYNLATEVTRCLFQYLGGSAIAAWGWTDEITDGGIHGIDGTDGDFPIYTRVTGNVFHQLGIWEKQASAFFQAKTARSHLQHNVVFNLGRAGFNFNDGFGGGDVVLENVLFHTCRESSDHGPINSWDRQPYLTTIRTRFCFPSLQIHPQTYVLLAQDQLHFVFSSFCCYCFLFTYEYGMYVYVYVYMQVPGHHLLKWNLEILLKIL